MVAIKNFEMPSACCYCNICEYMHGEIFICRLTMHVINGYSNYYNKRDPICPLEEIKIETKREIDSDALLNEYDSWCYEFIKQQILSFLRKERKQKVTNEEVDRIKYFVCCPWCDNEKCLKGTPKCEAEAWAKVKKEKAKDE